MVVALHEVRLLSGHIVAQIVEAELIIGAECDVAAIGVAALFRVRFGLIDAVHAQTVELIEGTHPLRVTLSQIVIDSDHMHTLAGESVEEYRQRSHESLTLTSGHLGDIVRSHVSIEDAMEHHAADELHIIVHHIPSHEVATGHP